MRAPCWLQLGERNLYEERPWLSLPTLPSNARYVQHENLCFDWGTFGWALFNLDLDIRLYKYFVFMNTSVRGPYLPSYFNAVSRQAVIATRPNPPYSSTANTVAQQQSTTLFLAILQYHFCMACSMITTGASSSLHGSMKRYNRLHQ